MQVNTNIQKTPISSFLIFIFLSFLLSLIFFILTIVGLSVGLGTLILWIGLPLLVGTFAMIRGIGSIERSLVRELLGVTIAQPRQSQGSQGIWRASLVSMRDPLTWKSLLYILFKFPVSIVSFVLAITFLAVTLGLLLAPLGYVIATFVLQINGVHLHNTQPVWLSPIVIIDINGQFEFLMFVKSFLFTGIGIVFWFLTRSVLRGLGTVSATLARGLLSPNE